MKKNVKIEIIEMKDPETGEIVKVQREVHEGIGAKIFGFCKENWKTIVVGGACLLIGGAADHCIGSKSSTSNDDDEDDTCYDEYLPDNND